MARYRCDYCGQEFEDYADVDGDACNRCDEGTVGEIPDLGPAIGKCRRCNVPIYAAEYNETADTEGICDRCIGRDEEIL